MPIQFLLADKVVFEYDDYLKPVPLTPERKEELRVALQNVWNQALEQARTTGLNCLTIRHILGDNPEELKWRLVDMIKEQQR